jgi:hypothetical protein
MYIGLKELLKDSPRPSINPTPFEDIKFVDPFFIYIQARPFASNCIGEYRYSKCGYD